MTEAERNKINELRENGFSYQAIANNICGTFEKVRSYLRRQKNKGSEEARCKSCSAKLTFVRGKMRKKFCSDQCRMMWWNAHQEQIKRKAFYQCVCLFCGKVFLSYGKRDRHYCGRSCFALARKKNCGKDG